MNRRYLEFIKFYRRGMLVVFLFCLTFLFLIMTLFTSKLPSSIAILANILLVICAIFSLIIALINFKKNHTYISSLLSQETPEECIDSIYSLNQENYLYKISLRVYETTYSDIKVYLPTEII